MIVVEILSTESTISRARPLSLAAPFLSYRNKLRHLPYMDYAVQHTYITVKCHKVTHLSTFKPTSNLARAGGLMMSCTSIFMYIPLKMVA